MIRGIYTAASGMLVENRRQENISQNLANLNTAGFKQLYMTAVSQEDRTVKNMNGKHSVGVLPTLVGTDTPTLMMTQGQLTSTGLTHDFAINGDGFFTVEGPNGENLYTRDGRFGVDATGRLTTKEGYPVLMSNGEYAYVNQNDFSVGSDGTFEVNGQNYQFLICTVEDAQNLSAQGDNLYTYDGVTQVAQDGFMVMQGYTEGSNVNATDEMVNLIASSRAYQTNSQVLKALDQVLGQAVNQIGKI